MIQFFGTAGNIAKKNALLYRAQQRLQNAAAPKQASASDMLREVEQQSVARRLTAITNKMKSGQKLSSSDFQFLAKHAPELFEKAVKIAKEREEYQKQLEKCRSKEEAQQLHLQKTQMLAAEAKAVSSAAIPESEKIAKLEDINMRAMNLTNEFNAYVQSERYQRLPAKSGEDDEKEAGDTPKADEKRVADERKSAESKAAEAGDPTETEGAASSLAAGEGSGEAALGGIAEEAALGEAASGGADEAPEPTEAPVLPSRQQRALLAYKKVTKG